MLYTFLFSSVCHHTVEKQPSESIDREASTDHTVVCMVRDTMCVNTAVNSGREILLTCNT